MLTVKLQNKAFCFATRPTPDIMKLGHPLRELGHWYLASGFMKDLIALFEAFDKQDSWRFCAFAECWQKYKFSLIYRGRYSFKELLEFSQEICFWTKKMLSPNHKVKWRVGALYALYGLYYKHPFRYFYKIRMEMEAYENMVNLMGLHFHCPERQWETMKYEMQWGLQEHSSESIFSDHKCNIQKTLMEEYEKVKTEIWGNDGEGLDKAMTYVQPNILTEVRSVLAELHHDDRSKTVNSSQESIDGNQEHAASTEMSEIDNYPLFLNDT
ncbi:snRNA-activating protein complex subunit 1 [Portunus trituberculatus]|uniref:snRNA-activating protein complex subunit 1 n=1 Tax=Portunus trituberculatus TaxID=210409 RepID=A0A5B7DVJ5_PORTR|nr:snRNA-activating protein complex subunit 1 [Portunus trituberculatus]